MTVTESQAEHRGFKDDINKVTAPASSVLTQTSLPPSQRHSLLLLGSRTAHRGTLRARLQSMMLIKCGTPSQGVQHQSHTSRTQGSGKIGGIQALGASLH